MPWRAIYECVPIEDVVHDFVAVVHWDGTGNSRGDIFGGVAYHSAFWNAIANLNSERSRAMLSTNLFRPSYRTFDHRSNSNRPVRTVC